MVALVNDVALTNMAESEEIMDVVHTYAFQWWKQR